LGGEGHFPILPPVSYAYGYYYYYCYKVVKFGANAYVFVMIEFVKFFYRFSVQFRRKLSHA